MTLMSNDNGFIVCSRVGSKTELRVPSSKLEVALCTQAVVSIASSALKVASITHDEHGEVIKMLEEKRSSFPEGFRRQHDRWHKFKRLSKEFDSPFLTPSLLP